MKLWDFLAIKHSDLRDEDLQERGERLAEAVREKVAAMRRTELAKEILKELPKASVTKLGAKK